ncbi:MAG: hypothetical protein NW203_00705 [Hyphomonadaceae bacterium]|nr:hypothetical protein [Hyphomonadaceae bacterium]
MTTALRMAVSILAFALDRTRLVLLGLSTILIVKLAIALALPALG